MMNDELFKSFRGFRFLKKNFWFPRAGAMPLSEASNPLYFEVFDSKRYNPNLKAWIPTNIP